MDKLTIFAGQKFGRWVVRSATPTKTQHRSRYYLCRCLCGFETEVVRQSLVSGASSGCVFCGRSSLTIPIIGQKFGCWLVLRMHSRGNGAKYVCRCLSCGVTERVLYGVVLRHRPPKQCLACQNQNHNLAGKIINSWQIMERTRAYPQIKRNGWRAECTLCGYSIVRPGSVFAKMICPRCDKSMRYPDRMTDGDLHKWIGLSEDQIKTLRRIDARQWPVLRCAWDQMNGRCFCPTWRAYKFYGALGITICPEWRAVRYGGTPAGFARWVIYMGPKPAGNGVQNSRIDHNRNYEPRNVRWMVDRAGRKTSLLAATNEELLFEIARRGLK